MDRVNKKNLITGFICIVVLGLSLLGGGNAALSVWNHNVRILNPAENQAGHDIGNHGDNHKYMTRLSSDEQKKEILGAHSKVQAVTGEQMELFRPPYGDYDE